MHTDASLQQRSAARHATRVPMCRLRRNAVRLPRSAAWTSRVSCRHERKPRRRRRRLLPSMTLAAAVESLRECAVTPCQCANSSEAAGLLAAASRVDMARPSGESGCTGGRLSRVRLRQRRCALCSAECVARRLESPMSSASRVACAQWASARLRARRLASASARSSSCIGANAHVAAGITGSGGGGNSQERRVGSPRPLLSLSSPVSALVPPALPAPPAPPAPPDETFRCWSSADACRSATVCCSPAIVNASRRAKSSRSRSSFARAEARASWPCARSRSSRVSVPLSAASPRTRARGCARGALRSALAPLLSLNAARGRICLRRGGVLSESLGAAAAMRVATALARAARPLAVFCGAGGDGVSIADEEE
jgi:hypothetical protein